MTTVPGFDLVQTFQIERFNVRGRLVRLHDTIGDLCARHDYPPLVAARIGEAAALTAVLASSLKYDGMFSLQIQGDGPLSMILIDLGSDGAMRGYARFDADGVNMLEDADTAPDTAHLLGAGHMAFTVDQGADMERYQGVTALTGGSLAGAAHEYFRQSEQLPTEITLFNATATDGAISSGALMIQKMPDHGGNRGRNDNEGDPERRQADDNDWRGAVMKLRSMTSEEFLSPELSPETLAYRLYHEDGVRAFEAKALFQRCRCSREKVIATLKSFPRDEIIDETGTVLVVCEFCKRDYRFDGPALDDIYRPAEGDEPS
ncbi:molecular chaperone Hsp33 [Varunaivibrio sulfuroxidans]|uniref:Molecular chaperone Hsp33 n=2 Tax=Varunaivibrio sulfuroxidans TaxID=1773489 RepID=A0A4R3JFP9_9PROT|nr:molecular chaperone Hsp33 [Varunaivibrio sulfuroxidans]